LDNKKIVYVVESLGGGVLTYLEQLCNNLSGSFDITILYGVRKQTPKNLWEIFKPNINLIEIKNFQREISICNDFKAYLEIKNRISIINPDIVHLNSSKAGVLGRLLKFIHFNKFENTKFYYTPHGYSFLMQGVSKPKRFIYYMIEKVFGNLNTKTIACGKSEFKYANKISSNSNYINNCVDTLHLSQFKTNNRNNEDVCYTIGRINYQKNPELFNDIALNYPNISFVWIGDGPLRNVLTAPNITVTGWLSNSDVLKNIQPYKYFILCSKWEGLPISLLESMYFGKICIVTDVVGNSEVINSNNGIKFTSVDDFPEISKINNSDYISKCAESDVISNYSLDSFIKLYSSEYNDIL
jgi:glycosyltransferase involved in cell wall biosynthesis